MRLFDKASRSYSGVEAYEIKPIVIRIDMPMPKYLNSVPNADGFNLAPHLGQEEALSLTS
jgi:hypothetical protein